MSTERDRILMNIAVDTAGSVHNKINRLENGWSLRFCFDNPAPQFIPTELADKIDMPLKKGDVVRCQTNPNHHYGISEYVESKGYSEWLVKEIGGERLCNLSNEGLDVLRFMAPHRLYYGTKSKLYVWATTKAFSGRYNPDAQHSKRCGGVEFDEDKMIIWRRAHVWYQEGKNGTHAQPKRFEMKWDDKTRLCDIVGSMKDQGFADDFEYATKEPTNGMAGCAKFTRNDIVKVLKDRY